jgi:hypothetical protein
MWPPNDQRVPGLTGTVSGGAGDGEETGNTKAGVASRGEAGGVGSSLGDGTEMGIQRLVPSWI